MKNDNNLLFVYAADSLTGTRTFDLLGMNLKTSTSEDYGTIFYVENNPHINILDYHNNSENISLASKKNLDFTSYFSSEPTIKSDLLKKIAKLSNVNVYLDSDDCFIAGSDIFSIHAKTSGMKTVKLPAISYVRNVENEEIIQTDTIQIYMEAYTTVIYYFNKTKKDDLA